MNVVLYLIAFFSLLVALMLRLAGDGPILNFVDYHAIGDRAKFNAASSNKLLVVSAGLFGLAFLAWDRPDLRIPLLFAQILGLFGYVIWVAATTHRFRQRSDASERSIPRA